MTEKPILDACCGGRMFYFDKHDSRVLFQDIRKVKTTLCDGRPFEVSPDVQADFTNMPYPDGSTYDSWSPKEVFEQAYQVADTFLDRMHIELKELTDKLDKLHKFFSTETYNNLPKLEQCLLNAQYGAMLSYDNILASRIHVTEERIHKAAKSE